jgi:DNA-3-methyladenine glycosylase
LKLSRDLEQLNNLDATIAAQRLLGAELVREIDGVVLRAKIMEVEAYDQDDPASHSFRGQTNRNAVMFGAAGTAYVYFTYGMHYCLNVVVGPPGHGAAVLIRALEPLKGIAKMQKLRPGAKTIQDLTNGPAKLTQALGIGPELNGYNLSALPLKLILNKPLADKAITSTTRIGITQAQDRPYRFYITGSPFVSKI